MNAYIHGQLATHRLRTHINEMRSVGMNHKKKQVTKDDKTSIKEGSLMQQYNSNNALQSISTKTKPCIMHIMMWDQTLHVLKTKPRLSKFDYWIELGVFKIDSIYF